MARKQASKEELAEIHSGLTTFFKLLLETAKGDTCEACGRPGQIPPAVVGHMVTFMKNNSIEAFMPEDLNEATRKLAKDMGGKVIRMFDDEPHERHA